MAERSFKKEVQKLYLGDGEEFRGEGILAVTKALLQSGVSYVAGYQGAPISHLMDVLADSSDVLEELGVHFEQSASEATAAATLAASVNYPLRGAVTFKSTVGTNVASDALANLASGGVRGGALIIVGEDYGEGSSIMQERSHAFAMKSQMWLLDPRPNLPSIVRAVEQGFELSEATNTPVMLELRIRACHVYGRFVAKDNVRPTFTLKDAMEGPSRDVSRIVLPPASFLHEREKIESRWPAAQRFIESHRLNEFFAERADNFGIILQGGMYNTVSRSLELLGLSDPFGDTKIPLLVLNVTYPLVEADIERFCAGKRGVLVVEEGQPNFIEQSLHSILQKLEIPVKVHGKEMLPMAGEYTGATVIQGVLEFVSSVRAASHRQSERSGGCPKHRVAAACDAADHERCSCCGASARRHARSHRGDTSAPTVVLHRMPGTPDLHGDEAGRAGSRNASRELRHRLSSFLRAAAVQHRREPRWAMGLVGRERRPSTPRRRKGEPSALWEMVASGTTD